jgi:salicylate hydroxylase
MAGLNIAICGAGIGGFSAALALGKSGHDLQIFEQTPQFNRIGADINLTPNAVFALDRLGCGEYLRACAARPTFRISRDGITGEETSRIVMSDAAEEKYGAPQLTIHRADLLKAMQDRLPPESIHLGMSVKFVEPQDDGAVILFADGSSQKFDLVIGADGVHSAVRLALFGKDDPKFTGIVSYRAVFARRKVEGMANLDAFVKWWGKTPDKQIVVFPLTRGEEIFVFATTAQQGWTEEGWTLPGDIGELQREYQDFHTDARALLGACDEITKSALHVREPMQNWSRGAVTILGDAAHPMVPFMAQGACMAIEDAVILARCMEGTRPDGIKSALRHYENARQQRTATVQRMSLENEWMKKPGNADWLYGYNAWEVPI